MQRPLTSANYPCKPLWGCHSQGVRCWNRWFGGTTNSGTLTSLGTAGPSLKVFKVYLATNKLWFGRTKVIRYITAWVCSELSSSSDFQKLTLFLCDLHARPFGLAENFFGKWKAQWGGWKGLQGWICPHWYGALLLLFCSSWSRRLQRSTSHGVRIAWEILTSMR